MKIKSLQNSRVKHLARLHQKKYRDKHNEVLIEGEHLLEELRKTDFDFLTIGLTEDYDWEITREIAQKISQTESGSVSFALLKKPTMKEHSFSRLLLLDGVQDPGNVGTIIRTAYSFGFDAVYASQDSADAWNDKAIRASQGAVFHIPYKRTDLKDVIALLQENKVPVYATHMDAKTIEMDQLPSTPIAVVMGSEGQGVSDEVLKCVNGYFKIPMTYFESLNVAVAAGIICYYLRKG